MNSFSLLVFLFFKSVFEIPFLLLFVQIIAPSHLALPHAPELHVVPGEDREDPGGGSKPGQANHHQRPLLGPPPEIAQRRGDGPVSRRNENKPKISIFILRIGEKSLI